MVMLRANDKALKVAKKVMKQKGIKVRDPKSEKYPALKQPFLQH